MLFVFQRTVSMAAVWMKHDQDNQDSIPLEDKHVVNDHHVIRKSHDATEEKCLHVMHFNGPRDWFERNSQHGVVFFLCCQLVT